MKRIYVAGAYSATNVMQILDNMRKGMRLSTQVLLKGYAPYCPWLDHHYMFMLRENESLNLETFYQYNLAWMEAADALIVVPEWENSKGTTAEIKRATELGIPVFHSLEELTEKMPPK